MNKTLIFRKIGGIVSEITEQYQYLAESPESISPLELELFIANSHFLSEHLAILKKLENTSEISAPAQALKSSPVEEPIIEEVYREEPVFQFINVEQELKTEPEPLFEIPAEIPEPEVPAPGVKESEPERTIHSTAHQQYPEYGKTLIDSTASVQENTIPEPVEPVGILGKGADDSEQRQTDLIPEMPAREMRVPEITPPKPVAEEKMPTLNEILAAGKSAENIAARISRTEDRDLRSMIKLNDKLMFIRDLFNGYSLAYSEAIDMVNRFDNFKAADNFLLQNYAAKNRWSEKQQTVDQFYDVLHKRFS